MQQKQVAGGKLPYEADPSKFPLHYAVQKGDSRALEATIADMRAAGKRAGKDDQAIAARIKQLVNKQDDNDYRRTAMHYLACDKLTSKDSAADAILIFRSHGADFSIKDGLGNTIMHSYVEFSKMFSSQASDKHSSQLQASIDVTTMELMALNGCNPMEENNRKTAIDDLSDKAKATIMQGYQSWLQKQNGQVSSFSSSSSLSSNVPLAGGVAAKVEPSKLHAVSKSVSVATPQDNKHSPKDGGCIVM
jgi:hypothetical protein